MWKPHGQKLFWPLVTDSSKGKRARHCREKREEAGFWGHSVPCCYCRAANQQAQGWPCGCAGNQLAWGQERGQLSGSDCHLNFLYSPLLPSPPSPVSPLPATTHTCTHTHTPGRAGTSQPPLLKGTRTKPGTVLLTFGQAATCSPVVQKTSTLLGKKGYKYTDRKLQILFGKLQKSSGVFTVP